MRSFEWGALLITNLLLAALTVWLLANPEARLDDSGLRILWQLVKGAAAGALLLIGCVLVFRKRAGIVLLHAGIGLIMFTELLTAVSAHESQMRIPEGGTVNYSDDVRATELAVIEKRRTGDDERPKAVRLVGEVRGARALIVDDEVASGATLAQATDFLRSQGAVAVAAAIVPPVLSGDVARVLGASRIDELVVTDSIPVPPEKRLPNLRVVSLAELLADAIRRIHEGRSLSELFD